MQYSPDQEILADLYDAFSYKRAEGTGSLCALGMEFEDIAKHYQLTEETRQVIGRLALLQEEEDADQIEAVLLRAHILRRQALEREAELYDAFCMQFEGDTRSALKKIPQYLLRKSIPYRIRNKKLHMDIFHTPAMCMGLDFKDVLIEDGHRPGTILMTRILAEKAEDDWYRFSFVSQTEEDKYPSTIHSFLFREVCGRLDLFNYAAEPGTTILAKDKLPWRRMLQKVSALTGKMQTIGMFYMNEKEMQLLPVFNFFEKLIRFYLEPDTGAGNRFDAIVFSQKKAFELNLEDAQIEAVRAVLPEKGCRVFLGRLDRLQDDIMDFCRFWIHYASTSQSTVLYRTLTRLLDECAGTYPAKGMPRSYASNHEIVSKLCEQYLKEAGFSGTFPCFYKEIEPQFVEVSSIYSKMYTYVNEKRKSRSVQIMESVSRQGYTVMAAGCDFLLKDKQDPASLKAMDGYFTDGGRRNINYIDSVLLEKELSEDVIRDRIIPLLKKAVLSRQ